MSARSRKVHFNALPKALRQRLVDVFAGTGAPAPIASFPEGTTSRAVGAGVLAALGLAGLAALLVTDFGSIYSFRQPAEYLLGYVLALVVLGYGVLACVRAILRGRALPFVPGRYILPLDVVIARDAEIEWIPTGSIRDVKTVHHHHNGVYTVSTFELSFDGDRRESFAVKGKEEPQRVLRAIDAGHAQVREAVTKNDLGSIRSVDAFMDVRGSKELDDPAALEHFRMQNERDGGPPLAGALSPFFGKAAIVAIIAGVVLGPPTWLLRNFASDAVAFARLPTASSYMVQGYIDAGGRDAARARTEHLPAAVFREATASRSAASLRAFVARFPTAPQVPSARAALHTLYDEAYAAFVAAAPADATLHGFMRTLLTFLETSASPSVKVRFFPPSAEALAAADAELERRGRRESGHDVMLIAPYFGSTQTDALERGVTTRLDTGFASIFAADVFTLEHGGQIVDAAPDPAHAALDVRYVVRPSGALYSSDGDGRAFVGIHIDFDVTMRSPGTDATYPFALAVEPPETFTVAYDQGERASESNIYATMTERAFDQLSAALSAKFFASASAGK